MKLNLQQNYETKNKVNLKTQNVMQKKQKNSGFRLWQNLKKELLAKLRKKIFLQNFYYGTNQRVRYWQNSKTNVGYLKTENPNLDKTQEIKSRKKIIFDKKSLN